MSEQTCVLGVRVRLLRDTRKKGSCLFPLERLSCAAVLRLFEGKLYFFHMIKSPSVELDGSEALVSELGGTLLDIAVANDASDRTLTDELVFSGVLSRLEEVSGAILD